MVNYINGLSKMEKKGEGERMRVGKAESKEERMHVKNIFYSRMLLKYRGKDRIKVMIMNSQ